MAINLYAPEGFNLGIGYDMEGKHFPVCPKLERKISQGVYDTKITKDVKGGLGVTPQCTITDSLFVPATAEFFANSDITCDLLYTKTVETDATNEFVAPTYIEQLDQSIGQIGDVLKTLPIELKESLKKTFGSDTLNTCFRPIQQKPCSITQIPQSLDWSVYNKDRDAPSDELVSSTSDGYQSDRSSIDSGIEGTNLLEGPAIYARKYFIHSQDVEQADINIREQDSPKQHGGKRLNVNVVPVVTRILKTPVAGYRVITPTQSPNKASQDQIASLQLENLYSTRAYEDVLIEQHTLRDGYEISLHEEQAHLDWLVMLKNTYLALRKDPNVTKQQLRTIKHRLASGLGREKWNRSDYYPGVRNSGGIYDSDCSDSTYSSITLTSYGSIVEQHTVSPSRIILDEPCTNYNFFGDDPPLFQLERSCNVSDNENCGGDIMCDEQVDDSFIEPNEFEFLGGNNFMHIKTYGWLELLPCAGSHLLSHVPEYHQVYYEMRNNFIVIYYDNKFNEKSRLHKACKVKRPGLIGGKFDKNYVHKKKNKLKYNEAVYDSKLRLFHFGDAGRGEDVKHLLSKENYTPVCSIILKGNYTFEAYTSGKALNLRIEAQTIPLKEILWTRLKESDDDFFPAATFQLPKSIEKTFSRQKYRRKYYKRLVDNVNELISNSTFIEMSVVGVSKMEHEDLISKAVSRKRAFRIVNHLNGIKVPSFQHLSHFYNCPHLRELSLANIKFDEKFDRYIFETSVKGKPLKMLDYRFRQITDSDLEIIVDYLSCKVEWMDLSGNNLVVGDKLDELVKKGDIRWLTLDGNHLPVGVVENFKVNFSGAADLDVPVGMDSAAVGSDGNFKGSLPESDSMSDNIFYMQMRERFLDKLDFQGIINRSKIYSGRLASFQWGLVLIGKTKQLVLRSDFEERIPENLLPLHYVYFELRGSYLMWFPNPLDKYCKKGGGKSVFQKNHELDIKVTIHNIFYILDCAVVKRAGFKWLKVKAIRPLKGLNKHQTNSPFYLYLRGPTDSVTNTWMTFMSKLVAGQFYLNTCDKYAILPSRAILDHCWQPWSQCLILYGYPNDYESLVTFMDKLRKSLRLKYLNASNMKFDGRTDFRPFEQIKLMKIDFSFNNFSMVDESNWDNVIDFCTKDVMTKEFVMDANPLGDNLGTAKFLYKAITSLTSHFIKFNYVDIGDVVGNQLCNLFKESYDSIGYVKVIELKGHNMTMPVLENLLAILRERCPNLEEVVLQSSIERHVKIANNILEVMDTEFDRTNTSTVPLQVVGQCIHHRRVKKGKGTTRHPNVF